MNEIELAIKNLLQLLNVNNPDEAINKLNDFTKMMLSWNQKFNITSITKKEEIFLKHFADSIVILNYIDFSGKKVIDVGTGAGFPGLPVYLINPDFKLTLIDSRKKKVNFLKMVVNEFSLQDVEILEGRAEEIGRDGLYRERFDYCLSRAVAELRVLLELCLPLVKKEGVFISWEKGNFDNKIYDAENALKTLKAGHSKNENYGKLLSKTLSNEEIDCDSDRYFAFFKKLAPTPMKYPRKPGVPKKRPL